MAHSSPDFNKLWYMMLHEMHRISNSRYKALLMNHEAKKERICRKLGIVSAKDVIRLTKTIEQKTS